MIRPERLGDLVVATPTFRALKESFPDRPLHVLADDVFADTIRLDPFVDKIIPIPWKGRERHRRASWLQIISLLRKEHYHSALLLYADYSAWNLALAAAGIWRVAQLGGSKSALLLRHKMLLRKHHRHQKHFVDWYLDTAALLGASARDRQPRLYLTDHELAEFQSKFPSFSRSSSRVIVHPFPTGSVPNVAVATYRRWILELVERFDITVFITGDARNAADWKPLPHPRISEELLGKLSVRELLCATRLADVVAAGSTGIIHVAAALGTPTIGFYCPSPSTAPALWGPRGPNALCLTPPSQFCQNLHPNAGPCSGTKDCDLGLGINLALAAEKLKDALDQTSRAPAER